MFLLVAGYYAGFIPRALGELASICLTAAAAYAINTYLLPDDQVRTQLLILSTRRFHGLEGIIIFDS